MTLIKSLLLGSAAGLVAVASAQAADLPTRKGPVAAEYVRICSITVAGAPVVGFVLPGSDTCVRLSGYVTGQIEGGNLNTGYKTAISGNNRLAGANGANASGQVILNTFGTDSIGYTTRYNLTLDAVSNTAYGPLVAHGEFQFNHGEGFENTGQGGSDGGLNRAYVTWAGLTAGKADSFFSFTGGGLAWANFFSPDRKGFNQPDLLAYTASFGGGFAATISIEDSQGAEQGYLGSATQGGHRIPDIVGALSVHQAWGAAQISGVAHNVRAASTQGDGVTLDKWGWAADAGVSFNIPSFAGASVGITGAYSRNDVWYSGIPDGMWGDAGQAISGNGQGMTIGDAFANGNGTWATPTAWSITGYAQFTVNPQVTIGFEGSYGQLRWTGQNAVSLLSNSKSFLVGGVAHYDPVKNLDFEFELLYQNTKTDQPTGYVAGQGACFAGLTCTNTWKSKSDGFASRFEVTRSF
jgi:Porin subfamily